MEETMPAHVAVAILEAFGRRDADAVVAYFRDDVVDDYVALRPFVGIEDAKSIMVEIFEAFPDFSLEIGNVVANDRFVSAQWTARGTFTGKPFQGLAATGKTVEVRGCDMMEIVDGKLLRNTVYYDNAGFARQVGALPPTGSGLEGLMINSLNTVTWIRDNVAGLIKK